MVSLFLEKNAVFSSFLPSSKVSGMVGMNFCKFSFKIRSRALIFPKSSKSSFAFSRKSLNLLKFDNGENFTNVKYKKHFYCI